MSEELNNHRPYTAAELSNLLHNERAERTEELNALAVAVGLERVREAGSILAAVERLASRTAPAVQVPDGWKLVPVEPTPEMLAAFEGWRQYDIPDHWPDSARPAYGGYRAMLAAAHTPATVATEAVAQGGGVDAETRGALLAFADRIEQADEKQPIYCSKEAADAIRALLTAAPAIANQGADRDACAKAMYRNYVDNCGVHCNRLPTWHELSEEGRNEWRKEAIAKQGEGE